MDLSNYELCFCELSGDIHLNKKGDGCELCNGGQPATPQTINDALRFLAERSSQNPLNDLARECHLANQTWWHDLATGKRLNRNKGELLMFIVSELSEAFEGELKDLMDDHLPHRKNAEVELADALIRIFDYAGAYGYDLDGAVYEKRAYNATRTDHKPEARLAPGGKKW